MKELKEIKLHLGCGDKHIDGFINVDVRHLDGVDLVEDIKELTSFKKNSVDVIYVSHVLEHFGRNEYMSILKKWYDLLKDGGGFYELRFPILKKLLSIIVNLKI